MHSSKKLILIKTNFQQLNYIRLANFYKIIFSIIYKKKLLAIK